MYTEQDSEEREKGKELRKILSQRSPTILPSRPQEARMAASVSFEGAEPTARNLLWIVPKSLDPQRTNGRELSLGSLRRFLVVIPLLLLGYYQQLGLGGRIQIPLHAGKLAQLELCNACGWLNNRALQKTNAPRT